MTTEILTKMTTQLIIAKLMEKLIFYGINNCFSSDILQLPFFTEIWGINTVYTETAAATELEP